MLLYFTWDDDDAKDDDEDNYYNAATVKVFLNGQVDHGVGSGHHMPAQFFFLTISRIWMQIQLGKAREGHGSISY